LFSFVFSDFPPSLAQFADRVHQRLLSAYRPSTRRAQRQACLTLAMFCAYFSLPFPSISLPVLLFFLEFLYFNRLSVPTIKNYVFYSFPFPGLFCLFGCFQLSSLVLGTLFL
jgi:hypothetical protein